MNEKIHCLERLTDDLIQQLDSCEFEKIEEFVEGRESIINNILSELAQSQLTEEQRHRLRALLQYDPVILDKMKSLKEEARNWSIRQKQIKAQHSAYGSVYARDSILMDKRK